jgi:hypothetical protein
MISEIMLMMEENETYIAKITSQNETIHLCSKSLLVFTAQG